MLTRTQLSKIITCLYIHVWEYMFGFHDVKDQVKFHLALIRKVENRSIFNFPALIELNFGENNPV